MSRDSKRLGSGTDYLHPQSTNIIIILDWGPVPRFPPPGSTAASVAYCMIPRLLNVPTLVARCLSRPQPTVVP